VPTPTQENTQRINELNLLVQALQSRLDTIADTAGTGIDDLKESAAAILAVTEKLKDATRAGELTDARHDERLKALEKSTDERLKAMEKAAEKTADRRWQFAPMVISAVGVVIAVVALVVKK
jgi:Zn-dependent metalloprotease